MNEFEVSRGYAAAGVPQVEIAGNELFILRWRIDNNIVDGEVQGVKFYGCTFKGIPAFGVLVDMMIRCQYSISDELAILRQRDSKPEEFAAYNEFAEQCKTEASELLGLVNPAPESEAETAPAESDIEAENE